MNQIPTPQKYLVYLTWAFAGFMGLGGVISVLSDAFDFITRPLPSIRSYLGLTMDGEMLTATWVNMGRRLPTMTRPLLSIRNMSGLTMNGEMLTATWVNMGRRLPTMTRPLLSIRNMSGLTINGEMLTVTGSIWGGDCRL
jgi:hypothetical protein